MKIRLNILFITPVNIRYTGGAEKWLHEVSYGLSLRGHRIGIVHTDWVPYRSYFKNIKLNYAEVYKYKFIKPPVRGMPIIDPSCLLELCDNYDIIYVFAYSPNEVILRFLKRIIRKPVIAGFHSFIDPWRDFLHKIYLPIFLWGYRGFDALHVLNNYVYSFFRQYGFGSIYLIPSGVDTSRFNFRSSCYIPEFRILFVGRLYEKKGIKTLAKIVTIVCQEYSRLNIRFIIAGTGPLSHYVRKLAAKYKDKVSYLGYVSHKRLSDVYSNSHLILLPSKIENLPLTLLEAQSCGLPAVASDVPGIRDIVRSGRTGLLVNVEDVRGFVNSIMFFYNLYNKKPDAYYEMRKHIRKYIVIKYEWKIIIKKIEKMLVEIIHKY